MERIRAYYDADHENNFALPTTYQTEQNKNELYCSLCGGMLYVDDLIFGDVSKVTQETAENSFLCEDCLNDYEEMAYR